MCGLESIQALLQHSSHQPPLCFTYFYCHLLLSLIPHTDDGDGATLVINSNIIDHEDFRGNPANSGTSKEQSDDDGDLEENTDPANTKKMRR